MRVRRRPATREEIIFAAAFLDDAPKVGAFGEL
jgi:hypothetical protein